MLFALEFSQENFSFYYCNNGLPWIAKHIDSITAVTESQFLPRHGKIVLVGLVILPVEIAIAVPTSIILV